MDETQQQIAELQTRLEALEEIVSTLADNVLKLDGILTSISNNITNE
jgi:hypothetical protein